jgi:NDP-sugar pyrophosphorylase family protein
MRPDETQVVVLAGGMGTRLGEAGRLHPKVLQPVGGRAFIDLMLHPLIEQGFHRFLFCLGHLSDQVVAHVEAQYRQLDMTFHIDAHPVGTAGSLMACRPLLAETFLLVLGDTYFDIDYGVMLDRLASDALAVMAITDAVDEVPGNVEVRGDLVTLYRVGLGRQTPWVDCGALVLRRQALELLGGIAPPIDLARLYERLIPRAFLRAHAVDSPFYDIGTPERLARFARQADVVLTDLAPRLSSSE